MKIYKALLFLTLMSIPVAGYSACTAVWNGTGTPNSWNDPNNWTPNCAPNGATDSATFNGAAPLSITEIGFVTFSLQTLSFSNADYTITSGDTLTFSTAGSLIQIMPSAATRTETLQLPVTISADTSLELDAGAGNVANLSFTVNPVTISNSATLENVNQGNQCSVSFSTGSSPVLSPGTFINSNNHPFSGNTDFTKINFNDGIQVGSGSVVQNANSGTMNGPGTVGSTMNSPSNDLVVNGGVFVNSNGGTIGAASLAGTVGSKVITGPSNITVSSGSLTNSNSGTIENSSTGSLISLGSARFPSSLNISGGTVSNLNTGAVDGTSFGSLIKVSNFGSAINISGGVLLNNDTVQSPVINITGGTLQGSATSTSPGLYTGPSSTPGPTAATIVTNSGGIVEPTNGTSPGTMTINGTYNQTASGIFLVDLSNTSTFSQLSVLNTANIDGTLEVDFLSGNTVKSGDSFVVLTAPTLSGTFATTVYNNLPSNLIPHVQYIYAPSGEVILSFTSTGGGGGNVIGLATRYAGGYIETVLSDINHLNSHINLRMEELRRHFARSSSKGSAKTKTGRKGRTSRTAARVERNPSYLVASNDVNFIAPNGSLVSSPASPGMNLAQSLHFLPFGFFNPQKKEKQEQLRRQVAEKQKDRPANFYFGATGRAGGNLRSRFDQPGLHYWSEGALMGFDYAFSHVGIGFMADYERIKTHAKQHWGKITVDEFHASLYSTYAPACLPRLAFNGIVGGAYEIYRIHRNTGFPSDKKVARGKPKGAAFDALFGMEYALGNRLQFIPLANVQYIYLRADGYKEHGAGAFDMRVSNQRVKSLRSALGFRLNYNWERTNFSFVPEIYGEWQREYLNKRRHIRLSSVELDLGPETLVMPGTDRNIALAGFDLLLTLYKRFGIEGSYELEYNNLYHDHFFYFGLNARF